MRKGAETVERPLKTRTVWYDYLLLAASYVLGVVTVPLDHALGYTRMLEGRYVDEPPAGAEALIVFGCNYARAQMQINERLEAAVRLWRLDPRLRVIVSGADRTEDYQETRYMREYLVARGVSPELVERDGEGFTSVDTVLNASRVFGIGSAVMVSSGYHVRRCTLLGLRAGIDAYGARMPQIRTPFRARNWLRDQVAIYASDRRIRKRLRGQG